MRYMVTMHLILELKLRNYFLCFIKGILLSFVTCGIYSFGLEQIFIISSGTIIIFKNGKTNSNLSGDILFVTFLKSVGLFAITCGWGFAWFYYESKSNYRKSFL